MKFICDTKKLQIAIPNYEDRKKVSEWFEKRPNMPFVLVSLPDAKTLSQNSAIWRDWTIAGSYLHLTKEQVYATLRLDDAFSDLFLVENMNYRTGETKLRIRGLSELNKDETREFITRYREFLQSWIDEEYGETVIVEWSKDIEKEKAYWEIGL